MTRVVQINLKQQINSALNNEQMGFFYQNGLTRTSLSATVTRVSNFVEENVCFFFVVFFHIVEAPLPGAFSHALSNRLNMSIAMHSACSKH